MRNSTVFRALAITACVAASTVLSACRSGENANENAPKDDRIQAGPTDQSRPVPLVIQMTGMLLLIPPKAIGGPTHILMPPVPNHLSWIGFNVKERTDKCVDYDPARKICYVDMNGWTLDPIRAAAGSGNTATNFPRNLLNLTYASGKKIKLAAAIARSRSHFTLASGSVSDSCSLAEWNLFPVGNGNARETISFINVMEWQIPDLQSDRLVLVRRKRGSMEAETLATLTPREGKIELLIMHVPPDERPSRFSAESGPVESASHPRSGQNAANDADRRRDEEALKRHLRVAYAMFGIPEGLQRYPKLHQKLRDKCPVTILGFQNADKRLIPGTKTPSCIMASAEEGP